MAQKKSKKESFHSLFIQHKLVQYYDSKSQEYPKNFIFGKTTLYKITNQFSFAEIGKFLLFKTNNFSIELISKKIFGFIWHLVISRLE